MINSASVVVDKWSEISRCKSVSNPDNTSRESVLARPFNSIVSIGLAGVHPSKEARTSKVGTSSFIVTE